MQPELPLVITSETAPGNSREVTKPNRPGSFVDNMKLPIHRWFRYSAGFSAEWVEQILRRHDDAELLLDPFAGSGTALLAADRRRVPSIGIEAHSFVARIAKAKLLWSTSIAEFRDKAGLIFEEARNILLSNNTYPELIHKCFLPEALNDLDCLKSAWLATRDNSPASELVWLAITAILRPTSPAGTAQWQYVLPNKTKKFVSTPYEAFLAQVDLMQEDMSIFQDEIECTLADLFEGDARSCHEIAPQSVDIVVTSPPYANNYDYADATRFEMSFWGEVRSWGDLHQAVRRNLVVSSAQHASLEKLVLEELLETRELEPIRTEIGEVCHKLATERQLHSGKKHYHTMIAAYFKGMAEAWFELRRVCKEGAKVYFVIGDSAPYGVHVPVDRWLGELALAAGFRECSFEKLRDRNIKWKNRKHRVPLHEGILMING